MNIHNTRAKTYITYKSPQQIRNTLKKQKTQQNYSNRNNLLKTRKQKMESQTRPKTNMRQSKVIQKSNQNNKDTTIQNSTPKIIQKRLFSSPAPSNQFKKYLDDTQNVFYQESSHFRHLKMIKSAKVYLTILLIFLVLTYMVIGKIRIFPKQLCPRHADCAVFIHCHRGYILEDNRCIIDPQIIHQAKLISTAVIEQLSYDYGNMECLQSTQINIKQPIEMKMRNLFKQFQIEDEILKSEVIQYCMNKQNQNNQQFAFYLSTIIPLSKKYSLSCSIKLFSRTSSFIYLLISIVVAVLFSVFLIRKQMILMKARKIYHILENKLKQQEDVDILQQKQTLAKVVQWDEQLWTYVDRYRSKQAKIGYYIQEQKLHWRKLP